MKLNKKLKVILIIISTLFCLFAFSGVSNAAKNGFIENIPGPRKYFSTSTESLSDVTLTLVSNNAIDKVEIYERTVSGSSTTNSKIIQPTESVVSNAKNHIYKFSHNSMLKGKTHYYTIKLTDNAKNEYESDLKIFVKKENVNGKQVEHYSINDSPRLKDWKASNTTLYFIAKDGDGTKSLKIEDLNSNAVMNFENLEKGEAFVTVDTNKFKPVNGYFKLKITAIDQSSVGEKSVQVISFKLSHETVEIKPPSIKRKIEGKNITLPIGDKIYFLDTQYKTSTNSRASDAFLIESEGKWGMIDTGTSLKKSRIEKYLKELDIKELEFLLITHYHSDHLGGFSTVVDNVKIKNLYIKYRNVEKVKVAVNSAKKNGAKIHYVNESGNNTIKLGNFNFKLYNTAIRNTENENENSVTSLVTVNGKTVYLAADIQNITGLNLEIKIAKQIGKVDIYKAAHHSCSGGTNTATALGYLKPTYAVITNFKHRDGTATAKENIKKYAKNNMYFVGEGTVILNISSNGKIQFTQLKDYYK